MIQGRPDVACDLWIIREWDMNRTPATVREGMIAEQLDDEDAGYGLPDDYTAGPRVHVFGADDFEVWLGCFSLDWISAEAACKAVLEGMDADMAERVRADGGPCVVSLDGRSVTGCHTMGVRHA